jgi:hypothetical protein
VGKNIKNAQKNDEKETEKEEEEEEEEEEPGQPRDTQIFLRCGVRVREEQIKNLYRDITHRPQSHATQCLPE